MPGDETMYTSHAPIRIDSDADFPVIANWGNGTQGNPWIIENWDINGTGYGYCIYIGNTTDYFVVRNCNLYGASDIHVWPYYMNSGILLFNVQNGILEDNIVAFNKYAGIYMYASYYNLINGNNASSNEAYGICLEHSGNNIIFDNEVMHNVWIMAPCYGISLSLSDNNLIASNNVSWNMDPNICLYFSNNTIVTNNTISNSGTGLYIYESYNATITGNDIFSNDWCGIGTAGYSNGTMIYHNNIINNAMQADDYYGTVQWDDGYPSGGNYWGDYNGTDDFSGPGQNEPGSDGIGDTPYSFTTGQDNYPLMEPWIPSHDEIPYLSIAPDGDSMLPGTNKNFTVTLYDEFGQIATAQTDVLISLETDSPTGAFYEYGFNPYWKRDVLVSFVFDDSRSISMRYTDDNRTWLEAAKDAALSFLNELSDDSVCVSIWDFYGNNERRWSGPTENIGEGRLQNDLANDNMYPRPVVRLGNTYISTINGTMIDGRQYIRDEIIAMDNPPGTTILWDAMGEAYLDTLWFTSAYPELRPAVVVLSDGMDAQASDQSLIAANRIEGSSGYWCPWDSINVTQDYGDITMSMHYGKYTLDWANPATSTYWLEAGAHGGSMQYTNRIGLLHADIEMFTVGLGVEHHANPWEPTINQYPGNPLDPQYMAPDANLFAHYDPIQAPYGPFYSSPPPGGPHLYQESGTLEYNLWRIANTSGGMYFHAPTGDALEDAYTEIGRKLSDSRVSQVTIPAGFSNATFVYYDTTPGTWHLSGSTSDYRGDTVNITVLGPVAHSPFRINSNADFTPANGVSAGDGSPGNPWVIENWDIDGGGPGCCLYIGNTTEHFIARDNLLHGARGNAGIYFWNSGLALHNVTNGAVLNNSFLNNINSIYLDTSEGNLISGNTVAADATSSSMPDNTVLSSQDENTKDIPVVETRYMSSEMHMVNGLFADNLGVFQTSMILSNQINTGDILYTGMRAWVRNATTGAEFELTGGSAKAVVSRNSNAIGIQTTAWNCPLIVLNLTDSVVIRIYQNFDVNPPTTLVATFSTEQLGATMLDAATWTIHYFTERSGNINPLRIGNFYWGTTVYNSRIEGFAHTTIDNTPPIVVKTVPADGATNVPTSQNVFVTFDEPMNTLNQPTLTQILGTDTGGWSFQYWYNETTAVWTHSNWIQNDIIGLRISGGQDLFGNVMAPYVWSFSTASGPTATATGPVGTSNVADITITYSWVGVPDCIWIYYALDSLNWTFAGNETKVNGTFDGQFPLTLTEPGSYWWKAVAIGNGSTQELPVNGTTLPDTVSPYIFDNVRPTVVSVSPQGVNVPVDAYIVIRFTKFINADSVSISITPNPGGLLYLWSEGGTVLTIAHYNFVADILYTITITHARDLANNILDPIPYSWQFRTDYDIPPNFNGISLYNSHNNTIVENQVTDNENYGILLISSFFNNIYHNSFINNVNQAFDDGINLWDDGYPSGGNYWSDYAGADNFNGPNQDMPGSDGIGDTPYYFDWGQDTYPLMEPFVPVIIKAVRNMDTGEYFDTIQAAISSSNTTDGHTIEVSAGTYNENVVVNKQLTIIGAGNDTTIIDGGGIGNVVTITVDWVTINRFTIRNSASSWGDAGIKLSGVQNCNIEYNNCTQNYFGIYLYSSSNNTIANNFALNNFNGIHVESSYGHNVFDNNGIMDNDQGIMVVSSHGCIILNNHIANNYTGIWLMSSSTTNLTNNEMFDSGIFIQGSTLEYWNTHTIDTSNTVNGNPVYYWKDQAGGIVPPGAGQVILANCIDILVENQNLSNGTAGILLGFSNHNTIFNNTVSSNSFHGIRLWSSLNNSIINNTLSDSYYGIGLNTDCSNNLVMNNSITNAAQGIWSMYSANNHILRNSIDSSNEYGIYLYESNYHVIEENTVRFSEQWGIFIDNSVSNAIYHNNFMENMNQAYDNNPGIPGIENRWDDGYPSGGNYWSDYAGADNFNGPTQDMSGPDGIGDTPYYLDWGLDLYPLMVPWGTPPLPTFALNMTAGWNLISIPLEMANTSIESVFSSISGNWDVAKYYDGATKTWQSYRAGMPTNTLMFIDHTMAVWLHITDNSTLIVSGTIPNSTNIMLHAGWNLVGYSSLNEKAMAFALWGTGATCVEGFDPESPSLITEIEPEYLMKPGEGYWIYVPSDTIWVIDW
ncbi:MAG: NosD domain-containing protein [Thermoplasmata archaeon]